MTTQTIIKMAFELGNAIAQSEEIESLQKMQIKLSADQEASALINQYQEAWMQAENKTRDGLQVTSAEEQNLEALREQLSNNKMVKELVEVQEKFNNLMESVYFAINQTLTGEGCSSDCSSCGGGCSM